MNGFSGTVSFGSSSSSPWFSLDINAVAFSIGSFEIRWYGILIGLGLLLALLYAFKNAQRFGIDGDRMTDVVFLSVIIGIIGARAYYVIFNYSEYAGRPFLDMLKIYEGGLGIYGGIIAGMLAGYFLCKWRKVHPLAMLDLASIGFLIGQGIGRWGNFMNQEAFGCNTTMPWGMYSSSTYNYLSSVQSTLASQGITVDPTMPVHPCFLYESIWCLLGFLLLHIFSKKWKQYDGQIFLLYMLWYGVGRFWIEELRTDSLMMGPYRISRFLAGFFVLASIVLLIVFRNRRNIFGEEGLRLQNEAIAEEKAKKAALKSGASAGKLVDEEAFTETDALDDSQTESVEEETSDDSIPVEADSDEDNSVTDDGEAFAEADEESEPKKDE